MSRFQKILVSGAREYIGGVWQVVSLVQGKPWKDLGFWKDPLEAPRAPICDD